MGEIKSTLDIIMEKTKSLTMTDEEKEVFEKRETEGKARGLLQKFLDSYIDIKGLKKEIGSLDQKRRILIREALKREGLARVEIETDNTGVFQVLENVIGFDTTPIRKILSQHMKDLDQIRKDRENRNRELLAERGISGTAIIPNINADQGWIEYVSKVKEALKTQIDGYMQSLGGKS